MNVYKFGGASMANADNIKNVYNIISRGGSELVIVVSALGKVTNEMEKLLDHFIAGNKVELIDSLGRIHGIHNEIASELGLHINLIDNIINDLKDIVLNDSLGEKELRNYDFWYDAIVSFGEILSSNILNSYLNCKSIDSVLIDARKVLVTDDKHRDASINIEISKERINNILNQIKDKKVKIIQGFIGVSTSGVTTTLGREGSDYSAAIVAVIFGSKSLTIWKDVDGVLSADPKYFPNATLIKQLNYQDAVELAHSGAQIIHPKTIRPLYSNNIELYVRSFINYDSEGSVVNGEQSKIESPIIVIKREQILLTIKPKDFSFVLEHSFEEVFSIANNYGIKINLVQNSAVSISMVVNESRHFDEFIENMQQLYIVAYNKGLELVTIRGELESEEADKIVVGESAGYSIYLTQRTRRLIRILREVNHKK